jgi:itaconate CoA-transferase
MAKSVRGCRVLELGGLVAGPLATLILADLGAEVIKVESTAGDPSRVRTNNFMASNPGKRSISLNLKDGRVRGVWRDLVASADVIVVNLGDKAIAELAVGYEECRAVAPQIVYSRISGFGAGPYHGRPATNPIVEAMTGLMSITRSNGKPGRQGSPFYDQLAGVLCALGAVAALNLDDRSDGSGYVETDLFETALFSVAPRLAAYSLDGELNTEVWGTAPYDTFETSDGEWIFLGTLTDALWRRFCAAFELTAAGADPQYARSAQRLAQKKVVDQIAQDALHKRTTQEALELLQEHGIPCARVLDFSQILADPHVRHDGKTFVSSYQGKQIRLPSFPVVGPGFENIARGTDAPALGSDSTDILASLGYTEPDIAALVEQGLIIAPSHELRSTS